MGRTDEPAPGGSWEGVVIVWDGLGGMTWYGQRGGVLKHE